MYIKKQAQKASTFVWGESALKEKKWCNVRTLSFVIYIINNGSSYFSVYFFLCGKVSIFDKLTSEQFEWDVYDAEKSWPELVVGHL